MAKLLSQELDPSEKLKNLLAGDNVDSKKKQQDGTIEEAKRDAILEQAFDDVINNQEFQNKAAAIYKKEGGWYFDKTGPGSLDALFDEYLFETPLYKNLETEKKAELDALHDLTGLELGILAANIKNDLGNIDLDNSDRAVFNAIQEIANKKVTETNRPGLSRNGLNNTGGVGSGNGGNSNNSLPRNGIGNTSAGGSNSLGSDDDGRENTKVNYHDEKNPDGTMKIGTTSFGSKSTEKGHDEYELGKYGAGDGRYSVINYAPGFVSKSQEKNNKKNDDADGFDPTADKKLKYKNKEIEYRDKNRQVHNAVLTIMKDFKKIDKNGEEGALAMKDVRGLDWAKVPDILYLITRDDKMKQHNDEYDDDESTGSDLSAWKKFVNESNDGISITPDNEKEFRKLLKGIDYTGANINKLVSFLNMFSNIDTIPYINKIIDIGSRKGKSGRMQLIETGNVAKLIDTVTATEESDEDVFKGDTWKKTVTETWKGDNGDKTAMNESIEPIEKTGNFFAFLADFNNDGRVDQYDVGPSMTGFAFHNMLTSICDVKKDGDNFEIVNGPQTSTVLRNMLEKAYSMSHNVNLQGEIRALLNTTDFVHTYHVFELIKRYPEIKPYMIYDIQAETEYSQKNRKIKNTYEAYNPDAANSLLGDKNSDPIEDYFTGEAIKDAMGDLHKTSIDKLKAIANAEGIVLNRKVDVDVIKAMNILVSTLFMNFGPLMRAMQYDRLQSNQNDPAHAMQYNYGNSQLAIEGKIPLSKEDLQRPWNGQETKEFIKSAGFKKWLQTTSINPMLGISTYADAEGKMQPSPVLGIGISFDKTKLDPSQKRAHHFTQVGVAFDVMDMQLFAGLNGSNVRQVNHQKLKDNLDTRKPYVKGLGMQYGVGGALDIKNPLQSGLFANVGPLYEIDHLAGLDQVSRNFETFLSPFTKSIDGKFLNAKLTNDADRDKLYIDLENSYLDAFAAKYKEPKYLHLTESMIHIFVGHLQEHRLLENFAQHPDLSLSDKQKIVQAFMGQRIDGFVSTLYQAELAKLNTKGLKLSKIGAKIGANLTVESLLSGGPIGVLFGMNMTFSAHNEIYGDDPHDINSVSKQLDRGAGMNSLNIAPGMNLELVANKLEKAFAINGLAIEANETDGTLTFTNEKGGSVLDLLHLYYTEDALKNAGFTFDGQTLVVGNVGTIGIANVMKGMSKAHYLILGSDKMIDCLEHDKYTEKKGAKKGEKSTFERKPLQPKDKEGEPIDASGITGMKAEKVKVLPTLDDIKKQINTLGAGPEKDILPYLKGVSTEGKLLLNIPNAKKASGVSVKNGEYYVPATGTLSFVKDKAGNIEVQYVSGPADKLVIKHKTLVSNEAPKTVIDKTEKVTINLDAKELFANARKVLEDNKVLIKTFDNVSKDAFLTFLAAAKNLDGTGIDHKDYVTALTAIKAKLTKHVNNKEFSTLLDNTKDEELVYIVNRLKAIFAENYVFKSAADVHKELNRRGNTYKTILGPGSDIIPEDIYDIREGFKKHAGATTISEKPNLLGYTAWYRAGGKEKGARGYSSTAYGHTNVLDGFIQEIQNKKETQQWMIEGLKKDQRNLDIIAKTINKSLTGKGITITANNLLEILEKGETAIDKTNKILKLNVKWYFYLLGECANESVGLALDGDATIETTKPDDDSKYEIKETSITPTEKTGYKLNASKTTKTIDMDVKGKKGDINFVGQGGVQVGKWGEKGGQGNEEEGGGQGTSEDPVIESDGGGQGTSEGGG